jgi:hypothetical protein
MDLNMQHKGTEKSKRASRHPSNQLKAREMFLFRAGLSRILNTEMLRLNTGEMKEEYHENHDKQVNHNDDVVVE